MKYVVYVAVANMSQSAIKIYIEEIKDALKDFFDNGEKVAYITAHGENEKTRIECLLS